MCRLNLGLLIPPVSSIHMDRVLSFIRSGDLAYINADIPRWCNTISSRKLLKYQTEMETVQTEQRQKVESRRSWVQVRKRPDTSLNWSSAYPGNGGWWLHPLLTRRLIKMHKIYHLELQQWLERCSTQVELHSQATSYLVWWVLLEPERVTAFRNVSCRPWWCADEGCELQVALSGVGMGEDKVGWWLGGLLADEQGGWLSEQACNWKWVWASPMNFQCTLTAPAQLRLSRRS